MAVSLAKNKKVSVQRPREQLEFVGVSLRWDMRHNFGPEFDLDISCFLLDQSRKVADERDFVFYNNPVSSCGSVVYHGDNRHGGPREQDEELINIDLPRLPREISAAVIAATIHDSGANHQSFGMVNNAAIEIVNRKNNRTLALFELGEAFRDEAAVIVCEFYRGDQGWKFRPLQEGHVESLAAIARGYGLETTD